MTKRIRTERKQFYNLLRYQRNQTEELRQRIANIGDIESLRLEHEQLLETFEQLQEERDNLRAEIDKKDAEIEELRNAAEKVIDTKTPSGEYTAEFRRLVYRHLGKNVPHNNVSSLIQDTLEFAGKEPSSLPTTKSIRRMNNERGATCCSECCSFDMRPRISIRGFVRPSVGRAFRNQFSFISELQKIIL